MPWMERKLGLVRAGAWAIVSEALSLSPVLASFYVASPPSPSGPAWSAALLFGGGRHARYILLTVLSKASQEWHFRVSAYGHSICASLKSSSWL